MGKERHESVKQGKRPAMVATACRMGCLAARAEQGADLFATSTHRLSRFDRLHESGRFDTLREAFAQYLDGEVQADRLRRAMERLDDENPTAFALLYLNVWRGLKPGQLASAVHGHTDAFAHYLEVASAALAACYHQVGP